MIRNAVITTAIAVMAGNALGADYMFPTAYPSGVDLDTVKQIVTFIWDDNAYSGLDKTDYETEPGQLFADHNWVGGMKPWENAPKGAPNTLNLNAGDFGMSWAISGLVGAELPPKLWKPGAVYIKDETVLQDGKIYKAHTRIENSVKTFGGVDPSTITMEVPDWSNGGAMKTITWDEMAAYQQTEALAKANAQWVLVKEFDPAGTKINPDGTPIQFTFNVISGLFVPIFDNPAGGTGDGYRVSKYGYWQPNDVDLIEFPHLDAYKGSTQSIPVAWGREQMVKKNESDEGNVNGETYGCINDVFLYTKNNGHEIGNHTIDHLESNSGLPKKYFDAWGGEGFAPNQTSLVEYGDTSYTNDEAVEFGRTPGISWHSQGWISNAGRMISQKAWKGLIELGEIDLDIALDIQPARDGGTVAAFRAPRLEVNSEMHYALADLGYLYDCGQEEGYEYHIDGKNFYWPYTTDNGSPNVSFQRSIGENVSIDSMPAGFWQVPVNAMIVPEAIRPEVWSNYKIVATAEGHPQTAEDSTYWVNENGKVTGFDFNMFILWGMTSENVLKTLKHNLDQRLIGGKAPMQIGSHTDYFSPIYDVATLLDDANRSTYGLCLDNGWNDWRGRISVFEDFIDYGINHEKDVYFWSGAKTIEYVKQIAASDKFGTPSDFNKDWTFFNNSSTVATSNVQNATGTIEAAITIPAKVGETLADAGFRTYFSAGTLTDLDHISLNYKTTAPIAVKLIMENDQAWEVWLNSLGNDVQSGRIPLSAFHYNQYADKNLATNNRPDASDIVGIEFALLTSGKSEKTETLSIKDIKVYTGEKSVGIVNESVNSVNNAGLAFNGISAGQMNLSVGQSGEYSVGIFTLSGRMVKSIDATNLTAGTQSVEIGSMPAGMYVLRIQGENQNLVSKALIQ